MISHWLLLLGLMAAPAHVMSFPRSLEHEENFSDKVAPIRDTNIPPAASDKDAPIRDTNIPPAASDKVARIRDTNIPTSAEDSAEERDDVGAKIRSTAGNATGPIIIPTDATPALSHVFVPTPQSVYEHVTRYSDRLKPKDIILTHGINKIDEHAPIGADNSILKYDANAHTMKEETTFAYDVNDEVHMHDYIGIPSEFSQPRIGPLAYLRFHHDAARWLCFSFLGFLAYIFSTMIRLA